MSYFKKQLSICLSLAAIMNFLYIPMAGADGSAQWVLSKIDEGGGIREFVF